MNIELPAEPHDSLDWAIEVNASQVLWRLKLGLEQPSFPVDDEQRFQASVLALKQFSNTVWPQYQDKTTGCVLYQGPLENLPDPMYFQMLAHKLPDELPIFLLVDERGVASVSEILRFLADDRFVHFSVGLRTERVPRDGWVWDESGVRVRKLEAKRGLVFTGENIDSLLENDLKVVFESRLTEEWDGLDQLLVVENSLSEQGLRKLKGFEAAGGEVETVTRVFGA